MSHSSASVWSCDEPHGDCRGCGTALPRTEPVLIKFHRCYYCGQHNPLRGSRGNGTAPVLIATAIGLIALWWAQPWS